MTTYEQERGNRRSKMSNPEELYEEKDPEEKDREEIDNADETDTEIRKSKVKTEEKESKLYNVENNHNENLIEYQEFIENDPNNVSLTKKVLNKDLAYELANLRTNANEGLGQCVYVNVNNPKVKNPYSVSADCYNIFGDFYGEVIERIHGVPDKYVTLEPKFGVSKHGSCLDLNSFDRRRERVLYTEVCVRRNLQDIPFTPAMNNSDRQKVITEIEPKIRPFLEEDESEELAWIPVDWERRMDLLKNELDDLGCMDGYPDDRVNLVFINKKNIYMGCIFNFDDHVQYIASSYDGRIGELNSLVAHMYYADGMDQIQYSAHPVYGHLTLNPQYIGTGFVITIMAKFPFLSRMVDVNTLVKDYDVTVTKECDNKNTGLMYMENNKTLNKTESEILKDMVRAFNKLSLIEDELEITTPMSVQEDRKGVENLYRIRDLILENRVMTYTKKYLTENVVFECARVQTNLGGTLTHCVRHNAHNPKSLFPRAVDLDCYYKFTSFFNPIILETNGAKAFSHKRLPIYASTVADKRYLLHHKNIYSYRVRFSRNLAKFPFPNHMSNKDRKDVERFMRKIFDEIPVELEGEYCPISKIRESIYLEDILEYNLVSAPHPVDVSAGFYTDWPNHRGIFICKPHEDYPCVFLVCLINVRDHIKIISVNPNGRAFHLCYERAVTLLRFLDLRLEHFYAKRPGFGFLTSNPSNVGCGMRISAFVKFDKLGDRREIFEKLCKDSQFSYRGTRGSGTPAVNNVFDISFKLNLNVTEDYVPMIFMARLKELIYKEREINPLCPYPSNQEDYDDDDSSSSESFSDLPSDSLPQDSVFDEPQANLEEEKQYGNYDDDHFYNEEEKSDEQKDYDNADERISQRSQTKENEDDNNPRNSRRISGQRDDNDVRNSRRKSGQKSEKENNPYAPIKMD